MNETALRNPLGQQVRRLAPLLLVIYLPALAILAAAGLQHAIPLDHLMADVVSTAGVPVYYGLFNDLGILMWAAALTVCLFSMGLMRGATGWWVWFFAAFALITLLLLVDDVWLIHSRIASRIHPQGSKIMFAGYGVLTGITLIAFHRLIRKTEYLILALALMFFALAIAADRPREVEGLLWLEDAAKLMGILSWLVYLARTAAAQIRLRFAN